MLRSAVEKLWPELRVKFCEVGYLPDLLLRLLRRPRLPLALQLSVGVILLDLFAGLEAIADQLGGVEAVLPSQARSDATAETVRAFGQRPNARGEHLCLRRVIPLLCGQLGNLLGGGAQLVERLA